MGLIKSAIGAIGSTFGDQWKEAIRCEDMGNEILMKKVTTENGVISNKSTIIVGPGQCAIIYDNGRVIDATAEEGVYVFDSSSTPSFFAGQFGKVFKEMWERFTYNGASAKEQAVFFFNLKEITENKFGTKQPIDYPDYSHAIPNQMTGELIPLSLEVTCFGMYTFKIENPAAFMNEIAGMKSVYRKQDIVETIRAEVLDAFTNLLSELGDEKTPVLSLRNKTDEIKELMAQRGFDAATRRRGIKILSFIVESVKISERSQEKIDQYELSSNAFMQQGRMVDAYSNAIQSAASNEAGSLNGFMGVGMMNMASNGMVGGATTGPWAANNVEASKQIQKSEPMKEDAETWLCTTCNKPRSGKFCNECGAKKPEEPKKAFCPNCGSEVAAEAKFCQDCGQKLK